MSGMSSRRLPSGTSPAPWCTPMMVPMVSNMSMKRKVKTTTSISSESTWLHSNLQKMGPTLSGTEIKPFSLVIASPVAGSLINRPIRVVARMPQRMPPRTLAITRPAVIKRPIMARRAVPSVIFPRLIRVASLLTIMPAFCMPIKAINRPIPAPMAFFSVPGMAFRSQERTLVSVRMIKRIPSKSTAVRANCQLYPIPRHTVYTKKALSPIPGASAKGFLA